MEPAALASPVEICAAASDPKADASLARSAISLFMPKITEINCLSLRKTIYLNLFLKLTCMRCTKARWGWHTSSSGKDFKGLGALPSPAFSSSLSLPRPGNFAKQNVRLCEDPHPESIPEAIKMVCFAGENAPSFENMPFADSCSSFMKFLAGDARNCLSRPFWIARDWCRCQTGLCQQWGLCVTPILTEKPKDRRHWTNVCCPKNCEFREAHLQRIFVAGEQLPRQSQSSGNGYGYGYGWS